MDDRELAALRQAAEALARQDGRGVPRDALVSLAGPGRTVTLAGGGDFVLAVVHGPGGGDAVFAQLTPREREVARLIALGRRNREIADALAISVATVKDHVHSILAKTCLGSRTAVAAAWRDGAQSA
jgi:two-component system nitrate/nitrite response regulator NarL